MTESVSRILIVEDEPILAKQLELQLRKRGWEVVGSARKSEQAVILAERHRPDLVMMDIHIEGKPDGIETAALLWKQFGIGSVFLTGFADPATIERAKSAEPLGYILKPYTDKDLQTTVEMALLKAVYQRRMRESETWMKGTLASIGDALVATDAQGRIRFMNAVAGRLTGWDPDTVAGFDVDDVFRPEGIPDPVAAVRKTLRPVVSEQDVWIKDLAGQRTPVRYVANPVRNAQGVIDGVVLTFQDMTARRKADDALRESEETFRQLIDNSSDLLWLVDVEGRTAYANPATQRLIGYNPDYVRGRDTYAFLHPDDRPALRERVVRVHGGDADLPPLGLRFRHRSGEQVYLETAVNLSRWGGDRSGVILNGRDVAGQRRSDEELARIRQEAEDRHAFKAGFLSGLSHEMRRPLTGIIGMASLMEAELSGEAKEWAGHILDSGRRLLGTMEAVVDLARVESGDIVVNPENVPLAALVNEVVRAMAPGASERSIRLSVRVTDDPGEVRSDPRWLRMALGQVLRFHLENLAEGRVSVTVDVDDEEGDMARVRIRDSGYGYSPDRLARMPHAPDISMPLSVAAAIASRLGGGIAVQAETGHWTETRLRLPIHRDEVAAGRRQSRKVVEEAFKAIAKPFYILVADDDAITRHALSRLLQKEFEVRVAPSLAAALAILDEERDFDLVLADIQMETEDAGFLLLDRLKGLDVREKPLAVALTGHASSTDRERFLKAGFDGYVAKPYENADLLYELKRLLLKR